MTIFSSVDLNSRRTTKAKKYYHKEHVLFQRGRRNLAVTIDPEVVDRCGLVAGLDAARFTIEADHVTLTFARRRSAISE